VTVLKRVTETAVIASPFFDDSPLDVSHSENLINIPLDRYLSKVEISVVEVSRGLGIIIITEPEINRTCSYYYMIDFKHK
jgi:hypothetical protein